MSSCQGSVVDVRERRLEEFFLCCALIDCEAQQTCAAKIINEVAPDSKLFQTHLSLT